MGRRPSPIEVIWDEGPGAFGFLTESFGFDGPHVVPDGLEFTRRTDRLTIRVWRWSFKNESGFETTIRSAADAATGIVSAGLDDLYVRCDLGPIQNVPGHSGGHYTVSKRILQHAKALRGVMPHLDSPTAVDLIRGDRR